MRPSLAILTASSGLSTYQYVIDILMFNAGLGDLQATSANMNSMRLYSR